MARRASARNPRGGSHRPAGLAGRAVGLLSVVAAVLLTACASGASSPPAKPSAPAQPAAEAPAPQAPPTSTSAAPRTVRVALQGSLSDAGTFVGMEAGYYSEVGLEIEPVIVRALPDMLPMLFAGQVEAAGVGINGGTLNAVGRQAGFKLVADKGSTTPGHGYVAWVVRNDPVHSGRLRTDADLRDLTFALS